MAQTFSGTAHLLSTSVAATAVPVTLAIWVNVTSAGQAKRYLALANSGDNNNALQLGLDVTPAASNEVAALAVITGNSNQALTSAPITTGSWQHCAAVFAGTASRSSYLNGGSKGASSAGTFAPTGINETLISGRASDFGGGISGQAAQAAVWNRALSDVEIAYLGAGGNPRAIKGTVSYWKIKSGESPVADQIGTNNLTVTGTSAGTSDPNLQSYMTGGPVGAQSYTVGTAIASLNLTAGGGYYDDVASAFTVALQQATATGTTSTTTSSPGTTLREIPMTSVSAFAAGDYVAVGGNAITRVLQINAAAVSLLVAADQTYSSSATVTRYAVSPLTVSGLSMSSNVYGGTPTVASTQNNCFFRATCNANSALMADTDVFTITITGGGGGSTSLGAGGVFSGGFSGG